MKPNQKKYDTSQEIFYKVCETGWNLCNRYLSDFAEFKPLYTSAYISNAKQALKNAEELTSDVDTLHNIKEIRIEMAKAARQVQHNWQTLKRYITEAYTGELLEIKLRAAGSSFYKKASLDNWNSLQQLIHTTQNFMNAKFDTLTANQNMPHAFPSKFTDAADHFLQTGKAFFEAKLNRAGITSCKIEANNLVYDTLIRMMKDAQQIFRYQPEIKKNFIFSNLVSVYENKNTSRGNVAASHKTPVQQANIISAIDLKAEDELTDMKNVA